MQAYKKIAEDCLRIDKVEDAITNIKKMIELQEAMMPGLEEENPDL